MDESSIFGPAVEKKVPGKASGEVFFWGGWGVVVFLLLIKNLAAWPNLLFYSFFDQEPVMLNSIAKSLLQVGNG